MAVDTDRQAAFSVYHSGRSGSYSWQQGLVELGLAAAAIGPGTNRSGGSRGLGAFQNPSGGNSRGRTTAGGHNEAYALELVKQNPEYGEHLVKVKMTDPALAGGQGMGEDVADCQWCRNSLCETERHWGVRRL